MFLVDRWQQRLEEDPKPEHAHDEEGTGLKPGVEDGTALAEGRTAEVERGVEGGEGGEGGRAGATHAGALRAGGSRGVGELVVFGMSGGMVCEGVGIAEMGRRERDAAKGVAPASGAEEGRISGTGRGGRRGEVDHELRTCSSSGETRWTLSVLLCCSLAPSAGSSSPQWLVVVAAPSLSRSASLARPDGLERVLTPVALWRERIVVVIGGGELRGVEGLNGRRRGGVGERVGCCGGGGGEFGRVHRGERAATRAGSHFESSERE